MKAGSIEWNRKWMARIFKRDYHFYISSRTFAEEFNIDHEKMMKYIRNIFKDIKNGNGDKYHLFVLRDEQTALPPTYTTVAESGIPMIAELEHDEQGKHIVLEHRFAEVVCAHFGVHQNKANEASDIFAAFMQISEVDKIWEEISYLK